MKHICEKCRVPMRPRQTGVYVQEMIATQAYKLWHADLWQCPVCLHQIITGLGGGPVRSHYEEDYATFVEAIERDPSETLINVDGEVRALP